MRRFALFTFLVFLTGLLTAQISSVLVEAETFENKGGWVVDQQFIPSMGSPYLLAHGMGEPVENASTIVEFPESGRYYFWVRTKDWVPSRPETPGTFKLIFDGKEYKETFGVNEGWQWVSSGRLKVGSSKTLKLELKDETGFEGRCDAIYFSKNKDDHPPVEIGENVIDVGIGVHNVCALLESKMVKCWGYMYYFLGLTNAWRGGHIGDDELITDVSDVHVVYGF